MWNTKTFTRLQTYGLRVAAVVALSASVLMAQESASNPPLLSLNEAIQLALVNNRAMRIASFEVDLKLLTWETKKEAPLMVEAAAA